MNRNELHKRLIEVAAKSPCRKRKVGAVLAWDLLGNNEEFKIVAEGYNYNLNGGDCEIKNEATGELDTVDSVIHAEADCLNNYDLSDIKPNPHSILKLYVTHPPCDGCKASLLADNIDYEVMGDFLKFDSNKPRLSLVPSSLVIGVAKVLTYGAKKYKPDNWRKVKSRERYIDALERHLLAYKSGEELDPESGLHHLEHLACNAAFLIELKDLPLRDEEQ